MEIATLVPHPNPTSAASLLHGSISANMRLLRMLAIVQVFIAELLVLMNIWVLLRQVAVGKVVYILLRRVACTIGKVFWIWPSQGWLRRV